MGYPLRVANKETYTAPPNKRATINCPEGCDYFDCAINDKFFTDCAVYVDGKLDCVATYRNYYHTKEWELKWDTKKILRQRPTWYNKVYVPPTVEEIALKKQELADKKKRKLERAEKKSKKLKIY
jgi:hypothetical protein